MPFIFAEFNLDNKFIVLHNISIHNEEGMSTTL